MKLEAKEWVYVGRGSRGVPQWSTAARLAPNIRATTTCKFWLGNGRVNDETGYLKGMNAFQDL